MTAQIPLTGNAAWSYRRLPPTESLCIKSHSVTDFQQSTRADPVHEATKDPVSLRDGLEVRALEAVLHACMLRGSRTFLLTGMYVVENRLRNQISATVGLSAFHPGLSAAA